MDVSIRQEHTQDHDRVYELVRGALARAEHGEHDEQNLVIRLRGGDAFVPEPALVALAGGQLVGHILFTRGVIRDGASDHATRVSASWP
jgi:predicted N-acetyltransferase YhbS